MDLASIGAPLQDFLDLVLEFPDGRGERGDVRCGGPRAEQLVGGGVQIPATLGVDLEHCVLKDVGHAGEHGE